MAIDGASIIEREYFDPLTHERISVKLSVRDHILFQLLEQIQGALGRG